MDGFAVRRMNGLFVIELHLYYVTDVDGCMKRITKD